MQHGHTTALPVTSTAKPSMINQWDSHIVGWFFLLAVWSWGRQTCNNQTSDKLNLVGKIPVQPSEEVLLNIIGVPWRLDEGLGQKEDEAEVMI
eukprot:1387340-Amphidinium_carterae.4